MHKKIKEETEINPEYNEIIDHMLEMLGGKEYCLRQLLFEEDHRKFITKYREKNIKNILNKISNFYESVPFEEDNIIDVEISSGAWNKYLLKLFFYDKKHHRIFEFVIKTNKIEETSLFEFEDDDETKNYSRSFFSKIKGGNQLWNNYNKILEENSSEDNLNKMRKEIEYFKDKMKQFKHVSEEDELKLQEADEQYKDGKIRFLYKESENDEPIYYYSLVGVNGYITFNETKDIMLEPVFAKHFYNKIVKKLRMDLID